MSSVDFAPITVTPAVSASAAAPADSDTGFTFGDLIDIVNPLQHIPVVSTIYRAITGDTIKDFPKIAGDTLYGGPEGFLSSLADTVFTKITGKSVGDTMLGWAEDLVSPSTPAATGVAANPAAPPATQDVASNVAPGGEDFGDRVVHWFDHLFSGSHTDDTGTAIASAAPAPALPTPAPNTLPIPAPAIRAPTPLQTAAAAPPPTDAIVVPGQDELLMALNRNGIGQDVALRAADAYRRTLNVAGAAATTALH